MEQKVMSTLELHLQHSEAASSAAAAADAVDDSQMASDAAAAAAASVGVIHSCSAPQWQLQCDRQQLSDFVQQQLEALQQAALATEAEDPGSSSSSAAAAATTAASAAAGCGQHIAELWQLLEVGGPPWCFLCSFLSSVLDRKMLLVH
jgi:hypothetical protein